MARVKSRANTETLNHISVLDISKLTNFFCIGQEASAVCDVVASSSAVDETSGNVVD